MREALWVMMTQVPAISSRGLRHLRPQAGARRPPSRRPGDPRHHLAGRPAARPGTLPRAADLARHLLGRAVLERCPAAAGAQRAHAGPAHRRRLHRRPAGHGGARRPVAADRRGEPGKRRPLLHPGRATTRCWRIAGWSIRAASASPTTASCRPSRRSTIRCWRGSGSPPVRSPRIDRAPGRCSAISSRPRGGAGCSSIASSLGYGPEPWLVGQYFPLEDATSDLDRLTNGAIVGGATLAVAALLALLIGLSHGALDPHHHLGRRVDRAAGVRPAVPSQLAAARDRRCRPQPRQGARRPEMVRRLRAAPPGLPVDGARRGRACARAGATSR